MGRTCTAFLSAAWVVSACNQATRNEAPERCGESRAATVGPERPPGSDNVELARMYRDDQAARQDIDLETEEERLEAWTADRLRLWRARHLYEQGAAKTGADFYHLAMLFQHGSDPEDALLAHELSVAAIVLGEERGIWLAAASEDRFLEGIDRRQRFGTQYWKDGPDAPWYLRAVDEGMTDSLRRVMRCPTLAEAQEKARSKNR